MADESKSVARKAAKPVTAVKKEEGKLSFDHSAFFRDNKKTLIAFGLLIIYAVLMTYIGFVLASIICGICFARLLGEKRIVRSAVANTVIVVILFLIFRVALNIILPRGLGIFKQFTLILESLF